MGMFDSFYFKNNVLPDNKVPEDFEFQTKDLNCDLDRYYVDEEKNVVRKYYWNGEEKIIEGPINCEVEVYSIDFIYKNGKYDHTKTQEYKLLIHNSKLIYAEKINEWGYNKDPEEVIKTIFPGN